MCKKEKETNKMKIKIYVNWNEGEILTEREFDIFRQDKIADILNDECDRAEYVNDYLRHAKGYDYADLLYMETEERRLVMDCVSKYVAECVSMELRAEFKEIELEV